MISSTDPLEITSPVVPENGQFRKGIEDWYLSIKDDPKVGGEVAAAWIKRAREQSKAQSFAV